MSGSGEATASAPDGEFSPSRGAGAVTSGHGLLGVSDAGAFLARLTRLDPSAVVRLRAARGRTALWARLPWAVLVTREVAGSGPPDDVTVGARELLAVLAAGGTELPTRRDAQWQWQLPPATAHTVESVSGAEVSRLAGAAAGTLRAVSAGGLGERAVGSRAVRDALLDHVALVVTPTTGGAEVEIPQRLIQAVARMGFLGPTGQAGAETRIRVAGRWVALSAPYGVAWLPFVNNLAVVPIGDHLFG